MKTLLALVERLERIYPVDRKRVAIMGFSLGAFGALEAAIRAPRDFSMVMPMGGGADCKMIFRAKELAFRVYHGELDNNVTVVMARNIVKTLEGLGSDVAYIEVPGANHDIRTTAFTDPELRPWLLSSR
jgi:predicted peptidase